MNKNIALTKKKALFFVALPYITADLHVGRLMGTFLPADILKNYYKQYEHCNGRLLSGLDCYGTSVYKELKEKVLNSEDFFLSKQRSFHRTLQKLGINLHPPFKTLDRSHRRYVNKHITQLVKENRIFTKDKAEFYCKNCDLVLTDRFLENAEGVNFETLFENKVLYNTKGTGSEEPLCCFCKESPVQKIYSNLFLRYAMTKATAETYKLRYNLDEKEKQISRPFLQWGLRGSSSLIQLNNNQAYSYYVWIEALLSYLELYKRYGAETTLIRYFYAKDNDYYHRVVYPMLLHKTLKNTILEPTDENVLKRNYVLDQHKRKFSSSMINFLNLDDFKTQNYDLLRFALSYEDCLTKDSTVSQEKIRSNCDMYVKKFVNGVNRLVTCLKKLTKLTKVPVAGRIEQNDAVKNYHEHMKRNNLKCALEEIIRYQGSISQTIDLKIKTKSYDFLPQYHHSLKLLELLRPITPKTATLLLKKLKHLKLVKFCKKSFFMV